MSNGCPRCGKPVYLVDEIRCLDKVWHKSCLRCQTCNRLLTILTYMGFDKQPYCEQHVPEAKHTPVADSYATRHAKEAAKLQSLLEYRKEYEATKGDKISVADDVVTRRLLANARNAEPTRREWNWERKLAMDDDLEQVTAEDEVMAPAPEECVALGPTDAHQDQSRPPTRSQATSSCSADPADPLPDDELPGKSTEQDTITEQQCNYNLLDEQLLETRWSSESLSGSASSCSTQTTTCGSRSSMPTLSCIIEQDDCHRCQGPINPRTQIDYKNKSWHRKCFKCQLCESPFCFALQMERQVVPVCINPQRKGTARSESRKTPDELSEEEEIAGEVRRALARPRTKPVALAADPAAAAAAAFASADDANNANGSDGSATTAGSCDWALPAKPTSKVVRRQQPDNTQSAMLASADKPGVGGRASTHRSSSKVSRYRKIIRAINVAYSDSAQKFRKLLQSKASKKKAAGAEKSETRKATFFSASTACSSVSSSSSSSERSTQQDAPAHRATAPSRAASSPVLDGSELDVEFELVPDSEDHVTESSSSHRLHAFVLMTSSPVKYSPTTAAAMFESGMPDFHSLGGAPEWSTACADAGVTSAEPLTQAHSVPDAAASSARSCRDRFPPAAALLRASTSSVLPSTKIDAQPTQSCSGQSALSAATSRSEGEVQKRTTVKRRRTLCFPATGIGADAQSALQGRADFASVQAAQESCSTSRDNEGSAAKQQKMSGSESAAGGGGDDLNEETIQKPFTFAEELAARGVELPTIPERSNDSESTLEGPSMEFMPALPNLLVTENNAPGRYPPYQQGDLLIDVKPVTGGFILGTVARSGDRGFVRVEHVRDPTVS